jgi:hypothetical protein
VSVKERHPRWDLAPSRICENTMPISGLRGLVAASLIAIASLAALTVNKTDV